MSPLYRSKRWLTLAQLVPAWATELADATTSARKCERQLWDSLLDDIINGRFDGKVPAWRSLDRQTSRYRQRQSATTRSRLQPLPGRWAARWTARPRTAGRSLRSRECWNTVRRPPPVYSPHAGGPRLGLHGRRSRLAFRLAGRDRGLVDHRTRCCQYSNDGRPIRNYVCSPAIIFCKMRL